MMNYDLAKIQSVIYILAGFVFIIIVLLVVAANTKNNKRFVKLGNLIFNNLSNISIFRNRLYSLRARIYNNTFEEDWLIRCKVILFLALSWIGGLIAATIVIAFFLNNLYVTFTLLFLCYQVKEMLLDSFIGNDTKFLESLMEYGVELQQAFVLTNYNDVRTAMKEANKNCNNYNLIKRMEQAEKLFDDPDKLNDYMKDCPNDYLKLLLLNCHLAAEQGDKRDVNNKSVFLENIFYNNETIEAEVFTRNQLAFWLKGLKLMCVLPFLYFSPYEWWATTYFNITDSFYKSKEGFLLKLFITVIGIILFYKIQGYEKTKRLKSKEQKESYWEDKFLKNNIIKKIVYRIAPKENNNRFYKYIKLISESGEFTTVERIFVQKLLFSVIGFMLVFSVTVTVHKINKSNILDDLINRTDITANVVATSNGQEKITTVESDLFQYVDENNIDKSFNDINEKLIDKGVETNVSSTIARDIVSKKVKYNNESINIIDIVISFFGVLAGYFAPDVFLKEKAKYRKQDMENEIIIFETIILIFMYHEHGTSELILEHMLKFADIFKPQVETALKDIKKSDFDALEILVEEIKYKPFLTMIKNLIKAENIKTSEAFLSLSDNRRNFLMNRKEENRRMVSKRVGLAGDMALVTTILVMSLYIAAPILYKSSEKFDTTMTQLNQKQ